MNERIKLLAEKADINIDSFQFSGTPIKYIVGESSLKKFAELIVGECAEVCRRQQYYDADDEHKRGVNGGSITCMNAIKQHFGVE